MNCILTLYVPMFDFYPRPPRGGRHACVILMDDELRISTHALREEGDRKPKPSTATRPISTHALREEGDL